MQVVKPSERTEELVTEDKSLTVYKTLSGVLIKAACLGRAKARELAEHLIAYSNTGSLQLPSVSPQNGTG